MPNVTYSASEGIKQTSGTGGFQVNDAAVLEDQDDVLALEIFTIQCVAETEDEEFAGRSIILKNLDTNQTVSFYMDHGAGDPEDSDADSAVQVDLTAIIEVPATADQIGTALAAAITGVDGLTAAAGAGALGASDLVTVTQHVAAPARSSAVGHDVGNLGFTFAYTTEGSSNGGRNTIQPFGNTKITAGSDLADVIAVLGSPAGGASAVGQKKLIVRTDANGGDGIDIQISNHETEDDEIIRFTAADQYIYLVWTGTEWATLKMTASAPA